MTGDVIIQVKAPAGAEPRHPTRRKPSDREAAALAHYPHAQRRELLRRLRAKEIWIRPDGLLAEVDPIARDRAHQRAAAGAARDEAKRRRRRLASASRSKNRRRR